MDVTLKPVTAKNFGQIGLLEVTESQRGYVASNLYSIAESGFFSSFQPRGIYRGDQPVGFLMYEWIESGHRPGECDIFRFMIDRHYQGQGLGRQAMAQVLAEIRAIEGVSRITICYVASNISARNFYASFGFEEVGKDPRSGEMVAEIRL